MHHVSLLFYPHILLLMVYVGFQRFWSFFSVFWGAILGGHALIFVVSKLIIAPRVLPTLYAQWSDRTLSYVFLGFYMMAILGNLIVIYSLWKEAKARISPWGWFARSFSIFVCVYGPHALISSTMEGALSFMLSVALGVFFFGLIYLSQVILFWMGIFKEEEQADLAYTIKWMLTFACSISIVMNLGYSIRDRCPEFGYRNHEGALAFRGDTWTFRKIRTQEGDSVKEGLQLDYWSGSMKVWQHHASST